MQQKQKAKGKPLTDEELLLPAYKIYQDDHRLIDKVESYKMYQFFEPEFVKQVEEFDINLIPAEEWNRDKIRSKVGHRTWSSYREGKDRFGYEVLLQREEEENNVLQEREENQK